MQNQIVQPLETVGGEELLEMQLPPKEFVIEGLLPKGLAMLVGSTKIGKSFLSLQIAIAIWAYYSSLYKLKFLYYKPHSGGSSLSALKAVY